MDFCKHLQTWKQFSMIVIVVVLTSQNNAFITSIPTSSSLLLEDVYKGHKNVRTRSNQFYRELSFFSMNENIWLEHEKVTSKKAHILIFYSLRRRMFSFLKTFIHSFKENIVFMKEEKRIKNKSHSQQIASKTILYIWIWNNKFEII